MKLFGIILIGTVVLSACGMESSPDGRSRLRDQKMQQQIDSLKVKNKIMQDSINAINEKLQYL